MALKTGKNANKLLLFYQKNLGKQQQTGIINGQEKSDENDIKNLQYKLYETSLFFVRSFTAQPTANNKGIRGRIKYLFQRLFRKGTFYIFNQLVEKIYTFQSKSLELSGEMYRVFEKHDKQLHQLFQKDDEIRSYINNRLQAFDNYIERITSLENEHLSNIDRIKALENECVSNVDRITSLENERLSNVDRITSLENEHLSNVNRITALENGMWEHGNRLVSVEEMTPKLGASIDTLEGERKYHADRLTALENGMWEHGNRLVSVDETDRKRDNRIDTLEGEQKYHADRLTALENGMWEHGNRLDAYKEEQDSIQKKVRLTENQIEDHQKRLASHSLIEFELQKINMRLEENATEPVTLQGKQERIIEKDMQLQSQISAGRNTGFPSFSQCGEDGIINYLLFVIFKKDPMSIHYLDIGCNDFRNDSNTYYLYLLGATGVVIDANPVCVETFRTHRNRDTVLNVGVGDKDEGNKVFYVMSNYGLSSFSRESIDDAISKNSENYVKEEISVPVLGINTLLEQYFSDISLDVLSIDAEGIDEKILSAIDYEKYRPKIIIVETIEYAPWIVVEQKRTEIMDIMKQKGYIEFAFTGVNSIFIAPEIVR